MFEVMKDETGKEEGEREGDSRGGGDECKILHKGE